MFDIFAEFAIDPKAEQEGRWFPMGTGQVLVARAGNPAYNRMINARYEQFKHELDKTDPKVNTEAEIAQAKRRSNLIMAEVMATTILLDSKDLGYKGQPVTHNISIAQTMLVHEEFQKAIATLAGNFRNFRFQTEEADAKNSEAISAGTSSGEASSSSSST